MILTDFLNAIVASPDDLSLRLVCSDFLEEEGQGSYADYIRLEVQIARQPLCGHSPKMPDWWAGNDKGSPYRCPYCRLRSQADRMFAQGVRDWSLSVRSCVNPNSFMLGEKKNIRIRFNQRYTELVYHIGFIEVVRCDVDDWRQFGKQIVKTAPIVKWTGAKKVLGRDAAQQLSVMMLEWARS